jgi:hypothetical protein
MPTFVESDLRFSFPDHWAVRAFDDQGFYKSTSGLGMKGVDFVAIDPLGDGHLFLIEVKNYRTRSHAGGTFEVNLKNADELVGIAVDKYQDSRRLIQAVYTYFTRRWWYLFVRRQIRHSRKLERDIVFWHQVHELLSSSSRKSFVLWVALEKANENYFRYLDQQLAQELGEELHTEIAPGPHTRLVGVQAVDT